MLKNGTTNIISDTIIKHGTVKISLYKDGGHWKEWYIKQLHIYSLVHIDPEGLGKDPAFSTSRILLFQTLVFTESKIVNSFQKKGNNFL